MQADVRGLGAQAADWDADGDIDLAVPIGRGGSLGFGVYLEDHGT